MLIRFLITICILLLGCTSSNAQKKDHDPLEDVVAELTAGRTEKEPRVLAKANRRENGGDEEDCSGEMIFL